MLEDVIESVTHPFKKEVSLKTIAIYAALFLILAWVVYDMLRILSSWMASATPQ